MALLLAVAALLYGGYRVLREGARASVYRQRLQELSEKNSALRERFNHVISETAVTELRVQDGKLTAAVVSPEGVLQTLDLSYSPQSEIHVDYIIRGGRLWIRRVYDQDTPPQQGTLIDPKLANIKFRSDEHGISIYRTLGEGRWVISVTPNGALSLQQQPLSSGPTKLFAAPEIMDFEALEQDANQQLDQVSALDLLKLALPSK